ncbi:polyprotein (retrotrasposon protein) [Pyrus ussuriensis x Pyrus communis]|uniref:Polyprotein (Retrotrasposon protein) n=1 Tax=Pyrus ussuriensis x Pyrus communis TaxID=2448454 RepID=A0A5N5F2U1_9ROSA|nr:polyprotein (retrotrasposon protein) [Pyrus ussuriensis x Pyrus communis]
MAQSQASSNDPLRQVLQLHSTSTCLKTMKYGQVSLIVCETPRVPQCEEFRRSCHLVKTEDDSISVTALIAYVDLDTNIRTQVIIGRGTKVRGYTMLMMLHKPVFIKFKGETIGKEDYGWVDVSLDMFGSKEGAIFDGIESPNGRDNGCPRGCEVHSSKGPNGLNGGSIVESPNRFDCYVNSDHHTAGGNTEESAASLSGLNDQAKTRPVAWQKELFMHEPSEDHMTAVMHIFNYLKGAPGKRLMYRKYRHMAMKGYTDTEWARNVTDRQSTSGYFTFVASNLVTWRSKKQHLVARSSAEAEYRGMALGICALLWIRILLTKIRFKSKEPMLLYYDNQAVREIANNPIQHDRTMHVKVDRHFIKEKLEVKLLADILTHAVFARRFQDSLDKLGLGDIYAPT